MNTQRNAGCPTKTRGCKYPINFRLSLLIISWKLAHKATNNLENRVHCAGGEAALCIAGSLEVN